MSAHDWLAHPWAMRWTEALLHFVWQGIVLAVVALLVLQMRSPLCRYRGLVATFVLMTACPFVTLGVLSWSAIPTSGGDDSALKEFLAVDDIRTADLSGDFDVEEYDPVDPVFAALPSAWSDWISAATQWRPAILILWLMGVAVFLARLVIGIIGLSRLISNTSAVPIEWTRMMGRLVERTGRRLAVTLKVSTRIAEPIAVWWWLPVILLPAAWLTEVPPGVLESVLAHELAHLRRWDLWINFYQRLGETLLFYHPGVWWVSRRIRIERELCCDAAAVALTGEPLQYARALEFMVSRRLEQVRPLFAAGMGGTEMTLLSRVQRVLGLESPRYLAPGWSLGLTTAAVLIASGLWLATASQSVVGEEPADATPAAEEERKDPPGEERDEPRPDSAREEEVDLPRETGDDASPRDERAPDRPRSDRPVGPQFDPPRGAPPEGRIREGVPRPPGRDVYRYGPPGGPRPTPDEGVAREVERRRADVIEGFDDRRGPPMAPDVMRELMEQIRALREEVADLRHEVRALRGERGGREYEGEFRGPPRGRIGDGGGPRDDEGSSRGRGYGPPRDGERRGPPEGARRGPPEGDFRGPPDGRRGPPRDGERGPDGRRGPPDSRPENLPRGDREADRPDGPPRGEGDRAQPPGEEKKEPKKDA